MNVQSCKPVVAVKALIRPFIPPSLLRARAERNFFSERSWHATHFGAFPSFAAANAHIASKNVAVDGFVLDHEKWLEERMQLSAHDYPPLFWLHRLLRDGDSRSVADFGGSVGVSYYAFKKYMEYPSDMSWTVCELPGAVEVGRRIARQRGETQLKFLNDPRLLSGASIFFAAGVLHYLEKTPAHLLTDSNLSPSHLIINKLPLSSRESFITIESGGMGFYPCRVQGAPAFMDEMRAIGYEIVDQWKCLEHKMDVALHPELSFSHYQGFVFAKR